MTHVHDVVVIGAGPSGLVAATDLVAAGLDLVVLEARDRVGGRTLTVELDGSTVDLGGQWVGPTQTALRDLLRRQGLTTSPTPAFGRNVLVTASKRQDYRGTIPRLPLLQLLELDRTLKRFDTAAARTHPRIVASPDEQAADTITVADYAREHNLRPEVTDLLRTSLRVVFGAEIEDVALIALLQYTRQAGGFAALIDTPGGAQDSRVVGGMQQVSQRLAEDLGDRVRLGHAVERLGTHPNGVAVTNAGDEVVGRQVVVAAPPNVARGWAWDVPVSAGRRTWLDAHQMGRTRKVQARFDRPFWRDAGLSGEAVFTVGPISVVFDDTRPMGGAGLVAFVVGDPAHRVAMLPAASRRELILDHLVMAFGEQARTPRAYREEDWHDDPFSGGCPVSLPMAGGHPVGFDPADTDHAVVWAGTETADRWRGYVDGAVRSGHRAARQAIARSRRAVVAA